MVALDDLLPVIIGDGTPPPSLLGALVAGVITTLDGELVVLVGGGVVVDGGTVGACVVEIVSSTGDGDGGLIMDNGGVGESDVAPSVGDDVIRALVMGTGAGVGFCDGLGDGF